MFNLKQHGTSVGTELLAGLSTFLTIAYILALIPNMLSTAGMPAEEVVVMITACGALGAFIMGFGANRPYVLAPGVGMGAFFTFSVVLGYDVTWQVALAATFVSGVMFILLAAVGLRGVLFRAIPDSVRMSTMVGIGLFLTIIGFQSAGITVDHPATLITLGSITQPKVLLALVGIILVTVLLAREVFGAIAIAVIVLTAIAWLTQLEPTPSSLFSMPAMPREIFMAMDFGQVFTTTFLSIVVAFFFLDVLDTAGTLSGLGRLGGLMDADGKVFGSKAAYVADASGTILGSALGTSPNTTFIESAVGMQSGGRTGLTAVVVGVLFIAAFFFTQVFVAVPAIATAPALIVAGGMMMRGARDLDWTKIEDIVPAFMTIASMAFTFNIAHGVSFGIVSHVIIYALCGRGRELKPNDGDRCHGVGGVSCGISLGRGRRWTVG